MAENRDIEEIFSKSVRAGRRTYFFDVRSTRAEDYYMTVSESKRDFNEDGTPFYKKHKIYLYKEDFAKFKEALNEVSDYIIKEKGEEVISNIEGKKNEITENTVEVKKEKIEVKKKIKTEVKPEIKEETSSDFTEVNFDDLGKD
ncbi:PUR family DNA/RNA-binding protein [Flavobacteriales bacterium]|nr:PUR family DNA/RNA-binding protein [Flavobacteriales bacterium]MDB9910215.1 PUR family DNA/RNA-binding protein [Flavobacteriales bacterium]